MSVGINRLQWAGLAFVVLIALLFRVIAIDNYDLDTDEAWTLALSLWTPWEMLTQPTDTHPFLYYTMHRAFFSPDDASATMRMLPVVFGVMAVVAMYLLGRLYFGVLGSLFCAALLAVWTAHVDYSMELRNYAAFSFFTLLSFYGFGIYWTNGEASRAARWIGLALFAAGCLLCFYMHIISVFPIALLCAVMLFSSLFYARYRLFETVVALGVMAILAIPGILWALKLLGGEHFFNWWMQPSFATFISTTADFFYPIGIWDNPLTNNLDARLHVKTAVIAVYSLCLFALVVLRRKQIAAQIRVAPALGVTMAILLALPLLIWGVGFVSSPVFLGRTILFCIPGLILLLASAVSVDNSARNMALGLAFVALYTASTAFYGFTREKLDWRGAVAFLEENVGPEDYIGLTPSYNYLTLSRSAKKPTGAGLWVTTRSGKPALARKGLGSETDWLQNYFLTLEKHEQTRPVTIELPPGTTVWRVDGPISTASIQKQNQIELFEQMGASETVWTQKNKYDDGNWLAIRRYRTSKPVQLRMDLMVDGSQGG